MYPLFPWTVILAVLLRPVAASSVGDDVYVLQQVQVVTRHGARTTLSKNAENLLEQDGVSLTPLGERQQYDLGVWLRQNYGSLIDKFDPRKHKFTSSALDRTIVSANTLALGLFPQDARTGLSGEELFALPVAPANVPVYTEKLENDISIRAYSNCPAFHQALNNMYSSAEWIQLENSNIALLEKLATIAPDQVGLSDHQKHFVPLENVWNVFDRIHVAKTECDDDPLSYGCLILDYDNGIRDALTATEWQQLQSLTSQAEQMKYGRATAGAMLGSKLWLDILGRIQVIEEGNGQLGGTFFLYSGHYPTLLGLFAALQLTDSDLLGVPDYASAFIVEVYNSATSPSDWYMRLGYRKDSNSVNTTMTPLDLSPLCPQSSATGFCPLSEARSTSTSLVLQSPEAWCQACQNVAADLCLQVALDQAFDDLDAAMSEQDDLESPKSLREKAEDLARKVEDDNMVGQILGAFFGGTFFGVLLLFLIQYCCKKSCRCGKRQSTTAVESAGNDLILQENQCMEDSCMTADTEQTGVLS